MRHVIMAVLIAACGPAFAYAQTPAPVGVDLVRLTDGKSAQVHNRALTVATEDGRAVARVDARSVTVGSRSTIT